MNTNRRTCTHTHTYIHIHMVSHYDNMSVVSCQSSRGDNTAITQLSSWLMVRVRQDDESIITRFYIWHFSLPIISSTFPWFFFYHYLNHINSLPFPCNDGESLWKMTGFIFTQKYRLEIKTRRNTQLFQNSQSVWIDKSNEQYIYFFQIYKKKKKTYFG